jgi:RNA polymerase sigma-70 factor (ECF subfamily)
VTRAEQVRLEFIEAQLIERAKGGDREAFWQLVGPHAAQLLRVACALVGRTSDAEDVVQESLVAALEGIRRYEGRASLRTWLIAIVARQAALWRRRRRPAAAELGDAATSPAGSRRVDVRLDVLHVLEQLSPEHRAVLVLREFEQMTYDEMAHVLNIPRGTVESRLHRARQEVRKQLDDYGPG